MTRPSRPKWLSAVAAICIAQGVLLPVIAVVQIVYASQIPPGDFETLARTMGNYDPGYLGLSHPWIAALLHCSVGAFCLMTGAAILSNSAKALLLLEAWVCLLLVLTVALAMLSLAGHGSRDPEHAPPSERFMIRVAASLQFTALLAFLLFLRRRRTRNTLERLRTHQAG